MNDTELLDYLKGLSIRDILQLARKSILLTKENRKLDDIKTIVTDCLNNSDEILCCDCLYADKCRISDDEHSSYDVAKYIKEIIES